MNVGGSSSVQSGLGSGAEGSWFLVQTRDINSVNSVLSTILSVLKRFAGSKDTQTRVLEVESRTESVGWNISGLCVSKPQTGRA